MREIWRWRVLGDNESTNFSIDFRDEEAGTE